MNCILFIYTIPTFNYKHFHLSLTIFLSLSRSLCVRLHLFQPALHWFESAATPSRPKKTKTKQNTKFYALSFSFHITLNFRIEYNTMKHWRISSNRTHKQKNNPANPANLYTENHPTWSWRVCSNVILRPSSFFRARSWTPLTCSVSR